MPLRPWSGLRHGCPGSPMLLRWVLQNALADFEARYFGGGGMRTSGAHGSGGSTLGGTSVLNKAGRERRSVCLDSLFIAHCVSGKVHVGGVGQKTRDALEPTMPLHARWEARRERDLDGMQELTGSVCTRVLGSDVQVDEGVGGRTAHPGQGLGSLPHAPPHVDC